MNAPFQAWGFDDLAPLSGVGTNGRNGWGATVVDALSTMWVMGLDVRRPMSAA